MPDDEPFFAAIRDRPADDTPRLVYADWLDDHGKAARAEFVRVQCELAGTPAPDRVRGLRKREEELLKAHRAEWCGPVVRKLRGKKTGRVVFRRGFVEEIAGSAADLLSLAADIERIAPVLGTLEVREVQEQAGEILDLPVTRRVRTLKLDGFDAESRDLLTAYPGRDGLERLALTNIEFHSADETLAPYLDSPLVRSAAAVELAFGYFLHDDQVPQVGFAAAQPVNVGEIERLRLPNLRGFGCWGVGLETVEALAAAKWFPGLEVLDFECKFVDDEPLIALLASPTFPVLRELRLNENSLTDAAVGAVARCPALNRLETLLLDFNSLTDACVPFLTESAVFKNLRHLDIGFNRLTPTGVKALKKRFGDGLVNEKQL